jgi:hypothetical protein
MRWVGMRGHAVGLIAAVLVVAGRAHAQRLPRVSMKGPAAIVLVIQDAAADPPSVPPPGESIGIADVESDALWPDRLAELDKALTEAGMTIVDAAPSAGGAVRTVELAGGARATLWVNHNSGTITLTPSPTVVKPRGKCVAIPEVKLVIQQTSHGIDHHGRSHHGDTSVGLSTARLHDVDGDAVMDAFVPSLPADACPDAATWKVYAVRGSCGHYLGEIGPGYVERGPDRHHGYIDLETSTSAVGHDAKDHIPVQTRTQRTYAVRAGRYRQRSTTSTSGRCHHCGMSSCRRAPDSPD